jgi:hypothetical protein
MRPSFRNSGRVVTQSTTQSRRESFVVTELMASRFSSMRSNWSRVQPRLFSASHIVSR